MLKQTVTGVWILLRAGSLGPCREEGGGRMGLGIDGYTRLGMAPLLSGIQLVSRPHFYHTNQDNCCPTSGLSDYQGTWLTK